MRNVRRKARKKNTAAYFWSVYIESQNYHKNHVGYIGDDRGAQGNLKPGPVAGVLQHPQHP